jgi:hypothetical protein
VLLPCFLIQREPFFGHAQIVLSPLDGFFFEVLSEFVSTYFLPVTLDRLVNKALRFWATRSISRIVFSGNVILIRWCILVSPSICFYIHTFHV